MPENISMCPLWHIMPLGNMYGTGFPPRGRRFVSNQEASNPRTDGAAAPDIPVPGKREMALCVNSFTAWVCAEEMSGGSSRMFHESL